MGAWSVGNFDNDEAHDFLGGIIDGDDWDMVLEQLDFVTSDVPDTTASCCGLVAAELVAAAAGQPATGLPMDAAIWVRGHPIQGTHDLVVLASRTVERIRQKSELRELFATAERKEWQQCLDELSARLRDALSGALADFAEFSLEKLPDPLRSLVLGELAAGRKLAVTNGGLRVGLIVPDA